MDINPQDQIAIINLKEQQEAKAKKIADEKTIEDRAEIKKIINESLKSTQILSVFLYLFVMVIYNYITSFSDTLTNWILYGEFNLDLTLLISFISNILVNGFLIALLFFYPKFQNIQKKEFLQGLFGFFVSLIIFALILYYNDINEIDNLDISVIFSVIILPFLVIQIFLFHKNENLEEISTINNIYSFILGLLIGFTILDYDSFAILIEYFSNNWLIILFYVISNILLLVNYEIITKKKKSVKTMDVQALI